MAQESRKAIKNEKYKERARQKRTARARRKNYREAVYHRKEQWTLADNFSLADAMQGSELRFT